MKIALISTPCVPVPPPKYGGTELVVAVLVQQLLERGHEVVLYATGDSRMPEVELRSLYREAVWPPNATHELNHAAFAVRDILARDDIDIVHAHIAPTLAFAALIPPPMVYTVHHCHEAALSRLYHDAGSPSLTLVAISERQRDLLGPDVRARVVHHGLPPERFPLGPGGAHAAFIGRFAEEKGVHAALEAAWRARVPLRLAGQPHWKDEVYFRTEVVPRLGRRGVDWVGEAGHELKVSLLGGAFATLFPIDWEEPFGLVMIESMLCGTPVISFARGSAPEVIDDGVTGWLVADLDEMSWRLAKLARGARRFDRAACRERAVRRFAASVMAERYLTIYGAASGRPVLVERRGSGWAPS